MEKLGNILRVYDLEASKLRKCMFFNCFLPVWRIHDTADPRPDPSTAQRIHDRIHNLQNTGLLWGLAVRIQQTAHHHMHIHIQMHIHIHMHMHICIQLIYLTRALPPAWVHVTYTYLYIYMYMFVFTCSFLIGTFSAESILGPCSQKNEHGCLGIKLKPIIFLKTVPQAKPL